jgi:hypothetical protein
LPRSRAVARSLAQLRDGGGDLLNSIFQVH